MLKLNRDALVTLLKNKSLSHEERGLLRRELEAYDRLVTENPLYRYEPHSKQILFHEARTKVKLFLAGNRAGKTTSGVVDALIQAVDEAALPPRLRGYKKWTPPFFCRVLTPDFVTTMEGVIFHKLREWIPRHQLVGDSWETAYSKGQRVLRFKNGSRFDFCSFEQDLDKLGGVALHRSWFDEEPPKGVRRECQARLIDYGGEEVFTMTPLHGISHLYDDVYERRYEDGITVIEAATDDNPHLDHVFLEEFFADLTEEERQARRQGKFVHFGGLVLQAFDDDKHLVDELVPKDGKTKELDGQQILVGIDPGIARGGIVWSAFDRDNHMLVFDELYPKNLTIPDIAKAIREKNSYWGIKPDLYVIDPSARNRSLTNAVSVKTEFMLEGIPTVEGQNDRFTGVLQLRRRLAASSLTVTRNCVNWLWERGRWRVSEDEESSQDRRSGDSFKTVGPDHLMDPTRYLCLARIWGHGVDQQKKRRKTTYTPDYEPAWVPVTQREDPYAWMT